MASTPVEPTCTLCDDEKFILFPEFEISTTISVQEIDGSGEFFSFDQQTLTMSGGIDVCPACAKKAEAAYQGGQLAADIDGPEPSKISSPPLRIIKGGRS